MAKGQLRSNKETRKPKAVKPKKTPHGASSSAGFSVGGKDSNR
jgi:hypothetical protein